MISNTIPSKYLFKGLNLVGQIAEPKAGTRAFVDKSSTINIPFNKPYVVGNELEYIGDAIQRGKLSGDGYYTGKCQQFFEGRYKVKKCFLTSSCSDALEMSAILLDIKEDDEVIVPSYTFVSSANAFIMRGANIVFADSRVDHPGMDESVLRKLITSKTKAIIVVHYAGVASDMDMIMKIADEYGLYVVEDAAQAVDATYKGRALGTIGHLGTLSFHETKNISSGEGGLLMVNDKSLIERAEIIREKGTDRKKFMRGEVDKYGWVDVGSSYLPSEMTAAFLYCQLQHIKDIQTKRMKIWNRYYEELKELEVLGYAKMPVLPDYANHNAHIFYIVLPNQNIQDELRKYLKKMGISTVFHYTPLHLSSYHLENNAPVHLKNADKYGHCLLRLPLYPCLTLAEQKVVIQKIWRFFVQR